MSIGVNKPVLSKRTMQRQDGGVVIRKSLRGFKDRGFNRRVQDQAFKRGP